MVLNGLAQTGPAERFFVEAALLAAVCQPPVDSHGRYGADAEGGSPRGPVRVVKVEHGYVASLAGQAADGRLGVGAEGAAGREDFNAAFHGSPFVGQENTKDYPLYAL